MRNFRFVLLLSLLITSSAYGEVLPYNPLSQDYSYHVFQNITLPFDANIVNTIYQDDKGMIWMGSKRGLYGYDGYNIHEYQNNLGSDGNAIFSIVQIGNEHLCLGTDYGIIWFNLRTEEFEDIHPELNGFKAIRSLAFYDENLWIGTRDSGLYMYDFDCGKIHEMRMAGRMETTIYSLEAAGDKLFIGAYEHLSYYDCSTGERRVIELANQERLMVNSLLWDSHRNCIWVGTEGYLYRYDIDKKSIAQLTHINHNSFKTLALDMDRNLIAGTDAGLFICNIEQNTHKQVVHDSRNAMSLCNNVIWDILCDRNQNIWFATDRGISISQANSGQHYIHLSEIVRSGDGNLFTHLLIDSHQDYWLGGENGLIHICKNDAEYHVDWFRQNSSSHKLKHNRIRNIYEDISGEIWIATDGGVAKYERAEDSFVFYQIQVDATNKNANWAYSIIEDDCGRMWIASYGGGLFVCNKKHLEKWNQKKAYTEVLYHFDEGSGIGNAVYHMYFNDGIIWANTQNGLVSIDIETMEVNRKDIYLDNMIYHDGGVWYSSLGKLFRYDFRESTCVNIPFSDACRQIHSFFIENGNVWFTSSDGIFCIDSSDLSVQEILPTSDYYLCGLYCKERDEILLGGEDCINSLSLMQQPGKTSDSVFVTSIISNGEKLYLGKDFSGENPRFGNHIEFHERGNMTLELSSYSYAMDEVFYYQINNEDKWQFLGKNQNQISFVNLPGGTYSIQLSNSNPETNPNAIISEYSIAVPYPWYLGWKAMLLYIIVFACIILAIITRIRQKNREMYERQEKEKSLELSNLKMDFFVNISHELKTPLSLIIAPVSKLLAETSNAKQKEALSNIYNNAMRLNTLIHKVLDFRQLEAESEDNLIRSHVEVLSMVNNCINTFSAAISERNISVSVKSDKEYIWANLDVLKIESVIINLLSNAIKYVDDVSGKIHVYTTVKGNHLHMTISDNGPGIEKDELSLVFIRFFQGKNRQVVSGGTGIGLYLVKKYIELHEGSITIQSDGGTTVEVTIPLIGENACTQHSVKEKTNPEVENAGTVLIIDDNKEMVAFLAETLSQQYECRLAYNGKEGIEAIKLHTPDLIIVDQMMPEMNGFEVAKYVKRNNLTSSVPIIMLTAKDDMSTELESIKIGVDIFMPKPFDVKKLLLRVAQLLQKRRTLEKAVRIEAVAQPDFSDCQHQKSSDEVFMEKVTKAIEDNMGREDFGVAALAEIIAVDNKQLYRKLKQLTGITPVNYIRKLRMKKAAILLEQDKFTVSEIMFLVGYTNSSYFSKCFAEEFGMNPKEFQKHGRKPEIKQNQDMSE